MAETAPSFLRRLIPPMLVLCSAIAVWIMLATAKIYPETSFPYPWAVGNALIGEIRSGRLMTDLVASLFRISIGFTLSCILGIPLGLLLGLKAGARATWLPVINFFRNLSPIAWIPFAILWFGVGDVPVVFLIFMATFFTIALSVAAAVASIPVVYFRVAHDHGMTGWELLSRVTFPAILPQLITTLRVTAGVAWLVLVAAEMVAGRDGIGFGIYDARNGLRADLVLVGMIVIGVIGVILDRLLWGLTRLPSVRWGYEQ